MGEFKNLVPPMFIDFDPNIKTAWEAVILIQAEVRTNEQIMRNADARNTAYDQRNDPAWHRRSDITKYQVMNILKNDDTMKHPVTNIDQLNISDDNGEQITQKWLDEYLDYLNGNRFMPDSEFSARNTFGGLMKTQTRISEQLRNSFIRVCKKFFAKIVS